MSANTNKEGRNPEWDQEWPPEETAPLDVRSARELAMGDKYPRLPETSPRQRAEEDEAGEWMNPLFPLALSQFQR